jgi:mRNA-capping enzyme
MQIPFYERWKLLEKEVIEPRNMEREALSKSISPYYRYDLEPFGVRIMIFLSSETVSNRLSYLFKFLYFVSGEEEGFLVTIYCVKAPS